MKIIKAQRPKSNTLAYWDKTSLDCGMIVGEMRMWVRQVSISMSNGRGG